MREDSISIHEIILQYAQNQKLRGGKIVTQANGTNYKLQHKFLLVQICSLINKLLLVSYILTPYYHYAYVSLVWLQNII